MRCSSGGALPPLEKGRVGVGIRQCGPSKEKMIPTRPPSAHSRCFASAFLARKDGGQGPPMLPFSRGGKHAAITCDCPAPERGRLTCRRVDDGLTQQRKLGRE